MSKVYCKCGNCISDVGDPCRYKGWLMSDNTLDTIDEEVFVVDAITIMDNSRDVWECSECGSIAFGSFGRKSDIIWYEPENKKYNSICNEQKEIK